MEINYEITPADFARFTKETVRRTTPYFAMVVCNTLVYVVFLFADVLLAILAMFKNDGTIRINDPQLIIRVIIGMLIIIGSYFALTLYGNYTLKKAFAAPGVNGLFCEHNLVFEDAGFTESTHVNRNFHAWESVDKIAETEGFVSIFVRLGGAYFIPKRAFPTKQAVLDLIESAPADITRTFETYVGQKKNGADY